MTRRLRQRRTVIAVLAALLLTPSLSGCLRTTPGTCDALTAAVAGKPGGSKGSGSKSKSKTGTKSKTGGCD